VSERDVDEALRQATADLPPPTAERLQRIAALIEPALHPVRPLAAPWILTATLMVIGAVVAFGGAARVGLQGIVALGLWARVLVLGALLLLGWLAAEKLVAECIPGSRHRISAGGLLALASVALLVVFGALFDDYHVEHFLSAGLNCLGSGLVHAAAAGLLSWLLLRRALAVNAVAAGAAAGVFAGLSGVTMLELHCTNFTAPHVLLWHTLVVPVGCAIGAALGWIFATGPDGVRYLVGRK
jgi:hypothetical protein